MQLCIRRFIIFFPKYALQKLITSHTFGPSSPVSPWAPCGKDRRGTDMTHIEDWSDHFTYSPLTWDFTFWPFIPLGPGLPGRPGSPISPLAPCMEKRKILTSFPQVLLCFLVMHLLGLTEPKRSTSAYRRIFFIRSFLNRAALGDTLAYALPWNLAFQVGLLDLARL